MPFGDFFLGIVLLVVAFGPLGYAAFAARRHVLRGWTGAPARLAEAVVFVVTLVVVAQILGLVGLFEREVLVIAYAATGAGVALALRGRSAGGQVRRISAPAPATWSTLIAVVIAGVVMAQWLARSVEAMRHGMFLSVDTLWYHGPMAARWVQDGSITGIHYFDSEPLTSFFPGGADLVHAVGIALMRDDVLSPVINLGWLAFAFLAAWCVGRPWGVGPACVAAIAVVLATPIMLVTQPGSMYTDVAGLATIMAAVALLVTAERTRTVLVLAALAAGFALGVKYTMIVPVVLLALGVLLVAPRGQRLRTGAWWAAGLTAVSGFWYLRNVVVVGNPVPPLHIALGPISLPSPPIETFSGRIVDYITDWDIVRNRFVPGLNESFGWAWWAILLLAVGGSIAALARARHHLIRVLGGVALVSILVYMVTPQALGSAEDPFFFAVCLRYAGIPLVLGLVAFALVPALTASGPRWWSLAVLGGVLLVDEAVEGTGWLGGRAVMLASIGVVAAFLLAVVILRREPLRASSVLAGAMALALLGIAGFGVLQHGYRRDRYEGYGWVGVANWTRDVRDARIALFGLLMQYPLYGPDLSNHVQWVSRRAENGAIFRISSCREWRRALNQGHYDYAVVTEPSYPLVTGAAPTPELVWTETDPAVEAIFRDGERAGVFRIDGRLHPDACGRTDEDPEPEVRARDNTGGVSEPRRQPDTGRQ